MIGRMMSGGGTAAEWASVLIALVVLVGSVTATGMKFSSRITAVEVQNGHQEEAITDHARIIERTVIQLAKIEERTKD